MARSIPSDLEREQFDVLVIGAGINGVAIARDAAIRGLRVLVLDKGDIGGGTTSWSTRLIHGGLRYLEYGEIGLVRESLRERERLLRNAAHLVKPVPLIVPVYAGARRGPALVRTGMLLYDLLSFDKSVPGHRMLSARETLATLPGIAREGLRGAARFYDAHATFAERLAVETALSAVEHGATMLTYARVGSIRGEGAVVRGATFTDLLGGSEVSVNAKWIVNCTGPWVDELLAGAMPGTIGRRLIGGTKGSHLVVASFPGAPAEAVYFEARGDGRAIFIVPWNSLYLIGSTDDRYDGDLELVRTDDADIDYLLSETNSLFPGAQLTADHLLYVYSGVRPLPNRPTGKEEAISRKHLIVNHAPAARGLLSVVGGKLTTHRSLAEEVVDLVSSSLGRSVRCETANLPLPGAAGIAIESFRRRLQETSGLPGPTVSRSVDLYGGRAERVLAIAAATPNLAQPFDPVTGAIGAEIVYAVREEMAETLSDILLRRTMVGLAEHAGIGADTSAAEIATAHLGWSQERAGLEVAAYRTYVARFQPRGLLATGDLVGSERV